jgi:uncharacterized protein with GYD domain
MPKYLIHGSYTLDGVRGLIKEGGSSRKSHLNENVGNLGGRVEVFYFAFGGEDIYSIEDLPDNVSSTAISLALGAGGGFRTSTIVLITPEEVDQATKKVALVGYRSPGKSQ